MIDIENKGYCPSMQEIIEFTNSKTFEDFYNYMQSEYSPVVKIEYSGEKQFPGWNVKYKKSGKTLCTVYPRDEFFILLLIVGRKEKPFTEELLPSLGTEFCQKYLSTRDFMNQRWMMFDITSDGKLLEDIKQIIRLRRMCK